MGERKLKFQDRWMFNRVLCEEEVCRKVLRAALGIEAGEIAYLNAEQCFEPLAAGRGVRLDVFARGLINKNFIFPLTPTRSEICCANFFE